VRVQISTIRHYITADGTYQLPFGRKRMFANSGPNWVDEVIGQWDVSGVASGTRVFRGRRCPMPLWPATQYDAPGILAGRLANICYARHKASGGGVTFFAGRKPKTRVLATAADSFEGPIGFQIGPRNELRDEVLQHRSGLARRPSPSIGESLSFKFPGGCVQRVEPPELQPAGEQVVTTD